MIPFVGIHAFTEFRERTPFLPGKLVNWVKGRARGFRGQNLRDPYQAVCDLPTAKGAATLTRQQKRAIQMRVMHEQVKARFDVPRRARRQIARNLRKSLP